MKAGAVLYVKDLDRMSEFYRLCFGLETTEKTTDYAVLESKEWTLSLVVVPEEIAATIEAVPRRRHNTPIKLLRASGSMFSTLAKMPQRNSRSSGLHGATENPQLPATTELAGPLVGGIYEGI